jgi:RNA polymerase sigma-70 factor (ECF subfamily)
MVERPQTSWTLVQEAGAGSQKSLEKLCRAYRAPVIAYIRHRGHADAEDLAQGFFAEILASDFLANADREKGTFRNYLDGGVCKYLARQRRDAGRQKRVAPGGLVSFELTEAEAALPALSARELSPEDVFQARWVQVIFTRARDHLREEYEGRDRGKRFERLHPFLRRDPEPGEYARLADPLELSVSGVASAVQRMRQRYGDLVRFEVADTCRPEDFRDEWVALGLELLR